MKTAKTTSVTVILSRGSRLSPRDASFLDQGVKTLPLSVSRASAAHVVLPGSAV